MVTDKQIQELTKGKVGYYWEEPRDELYPTLEVFVRGDKNELSKRIREVNGKVEGEVTAESYNSEYHRIMYVFEPKEETVDRVKKLVDILKNYGEAEFDTSQ